MAAHAGAHQDLPAGLDEQIAAWCKRFPQVIDDMEGLLTENRIFLQRNVDIGVATAERVGLDRRTVKSRVDPGLLAELEG